MFQYVWIVSWNISISVYNILNTQVMFGIGYCKFSYLYGQLQPVSTDKESKKKKTTKTKTKTTEQAMHNYYITDMAFLSCFDNTSKKCSQTKQKTRMCMLL